ncbi:MAG: hypothetical protein PHO92_05795 [Candidatus Peribacteraceae bacterium]|nr:hypothetical protein [Candidatus Peribacteraceae bacterium]
MATISPERLEGIPEEDPSVLEDVSEAEREVWNRLSGLSANVRTSVRGALASRTADEARTQYEDLPADRQRAYRAQEGRSRAIRGELHEEHLRAIPIAFRAEVQISGATSICMLRFDPEELKKARIQTGANLKMFLGATADKVPGLSITDLPKGKKLSDVSFPTPAQQEAIEKLFGQYTDVRQVVSQGGVHEANVRTALLFVQDHPAEVAEVLQGTSAKADTEIAELKEKRVLLANIISLSKLQVRGDELNSSDIEAEDLKLDEDIRNLQSKSFGKEIQSRYLCSMTGAKAGSSKFSDVSIDATNAAQYLIPLQERRRTVVGVRSSYKQISDVLQTIRQQVVRAGLSAGTTLGKYVDTAGNVIPGSLDKNFASLVVADGIKAELNLPDSSEIDSQIAQKAAEKKAKGAKSLTGMEAVLAIYEKHFELQGSSRPREAARELFARNEVGRQEVQEALHVANKKEVFGEQDRVADWGKRQIKQVFLGSQETYMANLGQALGLGRYEGTGSFSLMRGTRRFFSPWAKWGARPAWGAMDYPQLLTAYYSLRESVSQGHLTNSAYVRSQRDEIIRLLSSKFIKKFVADFDANAMADNGGEDDAREGGATDQLRKSVQNALRNLYAGEAPEPYGSDAKTAVAEAATRTASVRKFIGRTTKKVVVGTLSATLGAAIGRGSAKNPISWPAKTIKGSARLGLGALKGFWAWGTRPAKVFG